MGATLSVSSSKDQPSDDEKWLKTSAHDLFDLEVLSQEFPKLPSFEVEYDRESPFGGKLKQLFDHKSFMFSRNLKGEIARSSVDIRDLAVLFSIKDPLRLGDIDGNIFQSYGGIEEMIHSYVHEHSSYGGLNGLVPGGPRAAEIFETLYTKVISGQEHIDGELQRRIRARAVMRLYAAIVRNGNKQDEKGSGVNPTGTAKVTSDENTHDAVGVENSAQSQVVFTSVALNPRVITPDTVLSDLLFASGLSVGVATLKSLHGTAFYEQALRNVFDSLIGVFSATLRSVQPLDRKYWSLSKDSDLSLTSAAQSGDSQPDIVPTWDPAISSSTLVFSSNKMEVSRATDRPPAPSNSALCALASIHCALASFSVSITAAESRSSRPLTLGVAGKSIDMQKLAADGFGKCGTSWGLCDERSGSNECAIYAAGKRVGSFRRLRSGDIVNFILNARENWLDIVINFGEYKSRISLSPTLVQAATQSVDYVFGATTLDDDKLTILPYALTDLERLFTAGVKSVTEPISGGLPASLRQSSTPSESESRPLTCPVNHALTRHVGTPPDYIERIGERAGVNCDECGRSGIQRDKICSYHCAECNYDLCFVCSLPKVSASAVAKMNSMGQLASSSQSSQSLLLPSSPFASLTPSCETLQALDRVVHIARDYIESISGNNGIAVRHIPTLTSTGKGSFVEGIARRKKMQLVTDPSSVYVADEKAGFIQSQDLAVSFMFAVAVLKESLGALLEVAFLLSDEDILSSTEINYCDPSLGRPDAKSPIELPSKQLRVSSVVKDYADRLFTTAKDTTTPSVAGGALSSESFFSESKQADSDSTPSLFNASDWHHDPYLTRGDKQAIDIMYAAAEIGGGLKTAFSIDDDVYFDVLVCMVERGVALLHQAAVYRQMGNQLSYEIIINNRRARKSIFLMSAALKIVFFGLQRVSLEKKSSGSFNKTLLDIRCLSDSLIHPNELIPIERETVSNNLPRSPLGALPAVDANQVKSSASSSSSSSSSSEVIAETYRTRLCQIIDILVTNPLLQPESSFIGQSIVLYASMFDLLRPKASDQFAIICALLEKSDSSVETPCERALVVSLMSGMEGPKLLELITPTVSQDGDVDSSEEGDVEKFVRSILMLADRSLSSKIKKIVEISKSRSLSIDDKTVGKFSLAPVATGPTTQSTTEDVGEGILKVLEPTTIQTFCNLCQCVSQSSEEGNEAKLAHYQMKLIELLINLLFSARSTIEQLVASFDAFESRCASESEGSFESTLVDMYRRLDDQMKRSHVANLVPLVLFGSTLLWRHLINSGRRNQAKCLVNLFEPLHLIAKSLTPFINFEKRFRSILNADPDNNMPISSEPVVVSVPSIASWDPSLSNSNLEFTDDNLSCRRPGSASCYPAAFAQFPANKCSFSVTLSETLSTTNWLTIGVCASGFATSSSDGFGRSSNSWGIADDRSKESETSFFAMNSQRLHAAPRKLKMGDVLTINCDLDEGTLVFVINDGEFSYNFAQPGAIVPKGSASGFWFGATFANDHKLKVIANTTSFTPQVLCGKDESTWVDRLGREIRSLQFLTMQQYLEHPIDGIMTQTASALSGITRSQAMARIGGRRGRLERLLGGHSRENFDGIEDHDDDDVEDETDNGTEEDDDEDENEEDDDDDNHDDDDEEIGSSVHTDEDEENDEEVSAPVPSERRNGLSIQTSSLRPKLSGIIQVGNGAALPEELILVHNWCDSPLLFHGMFDTPTDPARLFEPSTPSALAFAAGFSMTSLSPLPNPGQIFFPPNSVPSHPQMSSVDSMLAQWAFLRQLTDAPNGSGLSQRLVGIMKKYVREDQGSEAGPNHAVHATCAALIWHEGLAEEALDIVKSSQNGVDRRPSKALQTVWKKSQAMRNIFPEDDTTDSMLTRSDSFKSVGGDDSIQSKPRLEMQRQFSLPVQSPLLPTATLGAVRRARLLLSYYPATVVTKLPSETQTQAQTQDLSRTTSLDSITGASSVLRGYFDLIREQCIDLKPAASDQLFGHSTTLKRFKNLTISECVTAFIHSGPDPDLVRKVADERSQLADNRAKGISVALELLRGTSDESKKADVLYKVAESIAFCSKALPAKTEFEKAINKKDSDKENDLATSDKKDKSSIDATVFRFVGCHYSNMLSGCTRHAKAYLDSLWLDFVKEVVSLGMTWLDQLEKSLSKSSTDASLEYALLGTLSIVGMDYCEGDIDYIVSSGIYLFLSTAAYSWNESVRRLSISSLERLLHLTCRLQQSAPRSGHEAPAYHTDAQNLPSAKSLFKLLLAFFRDRVKSSCEFSKMAPNILSVSRDLNDLPVTFVNQPFQPKWLLQGSVICDPNEEGLAIKASSMTPNFVMDPVDSSFHLFPDHSMSFWLYVERKCIDGTILTRLMGDIDAWSFVSIRLVDGKLVFLAGNKQSIGNFAHTEVNQLNSSKTTSDPDENIICGINMTAFDGVHVESSVLPCDQWVHVGYTIESKTSVVCLYVNGAVVSTKPLRAAMAAAPFPFQELLPQAMRVSQASQPFIIGQVPTALSSIGRSASCVVANIVVTCGPIDISEMVVLGSHTAPEVTRGLTTGSIKANTNSTESGIQYTSVADKSTAYSVIPRTGSDATISIKLESGQDSSKLSGVTFGLIAINNTDQYASFDNLHMFDANIKSFGFQCDVSDSSVAIGRTSPTSVPGIKSGDVVNLTYSFTAKKLILIINRSESDSISHEVSLKELDSNQVESMSLAFAVTLRNWQSATVIQPQDSRPQIIEKLTTMEEETKKVPVEDVPPVVEHINQIITSFDPDLSNTSRLEFASLNSTVYYPTATTERNQSLPPVTAVRLCQPRVSFTVMLSRNVMINDLLSVGLARIFTQASAEEIIQAKFEKTMEYFLQKKSGFGIEKGSYGIYDVRKEESEEPAKIAGGPSSTIKTFRKLVEGDMISWTVDFLAPVPWAEIVINGGEFTHRFTQLPGVYSQYVFGIVMAVEHEFVLIPDSSILDGLPLPSKADPVKIDASLSVSKPYPYKIILPSFDSTTLLWNWDSSFLLRCNQNAVKENVLFGSEASGLSISDRCSKKDVVRLCSSVSRVAKSLLALTIITNEYKLDDISSTDMPFDGIFTEWLVDDQVLHALADMTCLANSSTVRQAATKVICQLIPLLRPDTVDKVFNKGCFVPDSQNISFFHKVVRVLGQLANPYSVGIPDYSSQSSSFSQDFVTTSFRQTLDLVKSITHSPLQVWWREVHRLFEHSLAAFSEIIKDLSGSIESAQSLLNANSVGLIEKTNVLMDALSSTKTKSLSSVDVCDIVGFLTISCGGWIPSLGLLPGAVVSHSGPGNSLPERYVVAGFSPLSLFGETLVVYPLDIVDSNDPSEIEATSLSLTTFEVVFSAFLQSEQPATTLAPAIAYSLCHENLRLDVFSFLSHLILTDTSDQRPPLQAEFEVAQAPITPLERRMVMESPHPYRDNTDEVFEISIPGAVELVISFDPQSKTEANYDYLRFYKDSSQSSYWGQEKYSGTTWPGINGLEPLKIGAGSCLLQFHTDGSNNDWGYKFTVTGVMGSETDRPLRPPFPNLAFMRLLRSMAIECAMKVVVGQSGKIAMSSCDLLRVWGSDSDAYSPVEKFDVDLSPKEVKKPDASIHFEKQKSDFYAIVFPSLLKTLLVYNVSAASRLLKMKQEQKEVDISSVPVVSSTYIARILLTHKSASVFSLSSPIVDSDVNPTKPGLSRSERLFKEAVSALEQSCSSDTLISHTHRSTPRENEDKVDNFRELSTTLLSALSMPNSSAQFQCPDQADLSQVLDANTGVDIMKSSAFKAVSGAAGKGREPIQHHIDIESTSNSTLTGAVQYRLKCSAGTTHCRIRAGPSLNTAEVGDVVNFSIVEICGAVCDFYRLADGRGFVKISVDNTLSWERVEQTVSKRTAQLSVEFLDQLLLNELDDLISWGCYRFLSKLLPDTVGASFWSTQGSQQSIGLVHLLVKLSGLGKLRPGKPVSNRKAEGKVDVMKSTPLLASLKKMVNVSGISRGDLSSPISPLLLAMIEVSSGLFARKSSLNAQLMTGREQEENVAGLNIVKPVVIESEHEYDNNTDQIQHVDLPGAKGIEITFDEECSTERNYDFVAIYADKDRKNMLAGKFSGRKSSSEKNWPGVGDRASLIFEDRHDFWLSFITDGSNTDWGWRLTVSPLLPPGVQDKSLSDLTVRPIPMSTATDKVDSGARLNLQTYLATPSSGIALVEFGEGLTRPSLGVALALFDLLLDAAVTPEFLFETDTGCAILTNLSQCAGAIGDSQPWLARTFFDIVTRITLLYRHYRKMQGVEDSFNLASSSTEVRETMMLMSKHVLMLAYIAATSRRLTSSSTSGKSSNVNPSPLFQSICQAAVSSAVSICFDNPRLGPGPSAPALMRSDSIVDTNMELSTIEPKFDTLVRTTSVSSEPRDDAVKLAASLQSDTDTLDDADFVALAMDDKSSENDDESVDDYLDRLAPGQNGPIFPSMPYPFPSHPVEKNGSQNEVLISSLVQDEVKVTPVTATINLSTDSTQGQRSVPVSDKGYTYTHYVKVAKWGNPRGSQPFAIGVTLLTDPGSSELWEDEYSSGKVTFQNSLTWVSYPSRGPVLGGGDGAGSMSRFIWSQSDSDKLAIETIKQLESIDDAEADLEDSDDSLDVVQVAEESEEEEDDKDDKDSFLVGLGQKSSNEVFSVQSSVAFKEGDIVSITLNVSPSDWVGQKAPPAQVVFARNGTDIALFEVHCDNASALRFRPSWQGSEIANLNELIWANSKVTNTGKGVEIAPSSAFVSPVKSVGSPSYSPSSAFLGTTEKLNKFSHLLDRISDVNSRLRSSLTSSLQQALLPTGIAEDGPLLYSAGSSDRPIPGQPSIRIKPITSYFEPSVPSVNLGLSRQINTTIGTPPPAPSSISNLSPAAFAAIRPPSNRRMESSNIPLSLTRRHNRPQRSAGKKPVGRGSSAIKSDPSDQLPAAMAPLSVAVSLGNIHAEIRGEQGLDTPASRRNSIAPQSPMLLFHQDKTSRGSHIALLINIPQGGEVEYLIPSEVPTVARRPSTVAINTTRYAVTSSMIAGVSSSTSAAALPPSVKTITRVPTSIVERPLSLTEFSGRVLSRWEASISDTELQFSRKETVARRPGSVSCYPASLLSVPIDDLITTFALTMVLQHAPRGPNSMSIGIANAGFRSSGSDGFGQSVNSWGLIESRASGDGKLCSNRQHIDSFRKMREGDVFSIVYDRSLGKAWLLVAHASTNTVVEAGGDYSQVLRQLDTELCHEFTIHAPGERAELVLGATYCNDHELRILDVQPLSCVEKPVKSVITAAVRAPSPTLAPVSAPVSGSDVQSLSRQGSTAGASEIVPIMAFDLAISETALRFANGNRYAYRPGNVSCYPAAMALTPSGKSSFTAVLDECPFANNTMSFGIAVKGFPKSGQQAFGERADSWGIYNNRSENSVEEPSKICASGALVSKFRRLRQGDILRLVCDMNNRTVELSVNGPEFRQIFSLPPDKEFVYGATFCNHHALTLIDGGSARAESADTANPGLQTPEYMAIPFGVYVEQTIPFIAMPTTSTSNISALQSDDALEDAVKERLHVLRRYCKDSERALKELKLVVVPPNKQIKMMNCSMQTSLLPAELQSLSCLLTSLHLLQCDPYPSFRNRASVPNWRELIPGHVIYKHVLPNCMAWASASVHLPLLGPSLRALHNIKVEGAVGYAIQWLQPPHIPATHKLKIVASVYSYMPSAVKARLNGRKLAARAGGVTAVFNEEDGELDKQFLRKVVLCELFGGSEGPVTVSNLGQKKQSIASCNGILSVAAANLFSSAPNFVPTDTRINFPFSVGDSVVVGEEVLEGKYRPAVGEIGDVMSIQKPTDSTAQPKLYEVHVLWRDSPHREMYLVPERLPTGPVSNDVATSNAEKSDVSDISTGPLPEIKIWRKNPMANISGSLEHASKMFPLGSELAPRYLWTPVLTKEIDFILEPIIDSSMMPTSKKSARVDEPLAPDFEAVGLVSLLVTPILSPSAVVHSKTYRELLRHIVDHFAALGSGYQRDAVDGSLVRLLERVLKQKGQNNDRNVPDTLFKLGPSTEDVVHFPHLVLALNREAEWNVRLRDIVYGSVDSTNSVEPDPPSLLIGQSELFSHRFALIRLLNQEMQGCLELINLNIVSKASSRNKSTAALLNLADLLSRCRHYLFSWVKESFVQKAITSSGVDSNSPGKFELVISRSRAVKFASSGEIDSNGRWSVFGQVFRRVHGMPASVLRRSGQLWETVFAGERSHDSGGPYREAWSAIIVDLMSPFLPLLKPCPNNEGKVGMNQETYLINPDCVFNNTQMEMLVFFGKLMGSAARSTNFLDLYLSPLVWKLLVRQPLTLDDIRDIDITAYNQLTTYRQRKANASSEDTFLAHELHFCTTSKGGSLVELHSGGSTEPVRWGPDIDRYCDELEDYYLRRENAAVGEAVRAGIATQVPAAVLSLLRWEELEEMVCGRPEIDVDLLQSTAEYERGCTSSDPHILWLWDLLRNDFSSDDRKAFVRFAWGRSRLPLTRAAFTQPLKLQGFSRSSGSGVSVDNYLPVSHTCFFSVEIPRYSTKEILKQKLLYAVHNCTAIDGDDTGAGMRAAALGIEM